MHRLLLKAKINCVQCKFLNLIWDDASVAAGDARHVTAWKVWTRQLDELIRALQVYQFKPSQNMLSVLLVCAPELWRKWAVHVFQAAFSPVLTVASCVLWCVGGIEARSTFFPVDDSRPGQWHGTDCERGLGELLNTHTHTCTQTTRPFAEDVACCTLKKIQDFASTHKANRPRRALFTCW